MLNHLMLCMSRTSSYNLVTQLGDDFDTKVLSWMSNLILNVATVCFIIHFLINIA